MTATKSRFWPGVFGTLVSCSGCGCALDPRNEQEHRKLCEPYKSMMRENGE